MQMGEEGEEGLGEKRPHENRPRGKEGNKLDSRLRCSLSTVVLDMEIFFNLIFSPQHLFKYMSSPPQTSTRFLQQCKSEVGLPTAC